MSYSIIIPIHNEIESIPTLIEGLKPYANDNEIIIIDDGSNDQSGDVLQQCPFITLIQFPNNCGKGKAICAGLEKSDNEKIILFDGDLELNLHDLKNFMILNKTDGIHVVFGSRVKSMNPLESIIDFGNFFLNGLFNLVHQSNFTDVLCGCKVFFKSDLIFELPQSIGFDIDVEIASILVSRKIPISEIPIRYIRRSQSEGKKLQLSDGWKILKRIIFFTKSPK